MADADLLSLARHSKPRPDEEVRVRIPPPALKWKTRFLLPAAILLGTTTLLITAGRDALGSRTAVRVVPVLIKPGADNDESAGSVVVQAPGWVEADPFPVAVSALADGVVSEVLVLEGERVTQDQVVARLVDDDARLAHQHAAAMLAERKAALAAADARLREAENNWEQPIELTRRLQTAEAALAQKRGELARWPAALAREEAEAVYLEAEYERMRPLRVSGRANEIELVQARQAHEAKQAAVETVRRHKPILEAEVRGLEAEVRAAQDELRFRFADTRAVEEARADARRATAAVERAAVVRDEAALRLDRMSVRAPTNGTVMTRLAEPGSKLMLNMDAPHSAQVVRLYDPAKLQVRVDVPLVDAAKVGVGQAAEVIVDVLPNQVFGGHVTRIVHEADVQKNTLQVKVAISDPSTAIKPEMLARARFLGSARANAESTTGAERLFVPRAALIERDGQTVVWLADQAEDVARVRTVIAGRTTIDDWILVREGLRPGDRVIIDPPAGLTDEQRIRIVEQ